MLDALAGSQGGVFTRQQALAAGYTVDEVAWRVSSSRWTVVRRGVYTAATLPEDARAAHLLQGAAVLLSRMAVVLSHRTASVAHGLPLLTPPTHVDVITAGAGTGSVRAGVHQHEGAPCEDTISVGGLATTSVVRTCVDVAGLLPHRDAVVVVDAALNRGLVRRIELAARLDSSQNARTRRRGRRVLDAADERAESAGESVTRVLMNAHGMRPESNVHIGKDRVDFLFRGEGVIVEFDGRIKYTDGDVLWKEKRRQERLERQGFIVVRVTWQDVLHDPETTIARIRAALRRGAGR